MGGKKRICLVTAAPLTIRFFLQGQIVALAKRYDVSVITNTDDVDFLEHLGVPVRVIPLRIERRVSLWYDLLALIRLVMIFSREDFDLVHSHSPKAGLLTMVAGWLARVPFRIHTFQGEVWATRRGLWRFMLKSLDRLAARCATQLLVVSRSENAFLVEQGVVRQGELTMLANGSVCGVDLQRFSPDREQCDRMRASIGIGDDEVVMLYLGRLTKDKGVLDLAAAFSTLADRFPTLRLLMVGPDEEGLRDIIAGQYASLMSRIHFVDYTDKPERYMVAADLLCLPSYREGFGLVLLEAAAAGIPAVGSRIYGITDAVIESETGLLFKAGDVDDLSANLGRLVEDPELRARLGENGMARVKRDFSKELVISSLLQYYDDLLHSQPRDTAG